MPESITVGDLVVRIRADINQLARGLNAAQNGINGMSNGARPGLRRLETAFLAIGVRAAGIQGPIGSLSRQLLQFAGGGLVTAGVIAGVGAMALAWQKLTEKTKDLKQQADEAAKSLLKLPEQVAIAQAQMTAGQRALKLERERQLLTGEAEPTTFRERLLTTQRIPGSAYAVARLKEIVPELARLQSAVAAGTQTITDLLIKDESALAAYFDRWEQFDAQARVWAKRNDIAKLTGEQREALLEAERALEAYVQGWRSWDAQAKKQAQETRIQRTLFTIQSGITDPSGRALPNFAALVEEAMRQARATLRKSQQFLRLEQLKLDLVSGFREIGIAAGAALAEGIAGGYKMTIGGFLRSIFSQVVGHIVRVGLNALIPIPGISAAKVAPVAIGGAVDFSSFPAATNPLASARDKDWQRFLRESQLVAASQGFRA